MKYVISLLSLAVAFSYTNAVFAAENETDESAIDDEVIEEVVVTAHASNGTNIPVRHPYRS